MKSLKTIQALFKIGSVLSKIAFILSVIGFCGCIAGLIDVSFGKAGLIKLGGVTLHSLITKDLGFNNKSIAAALFGWLIICAGEAVLSKFAEIYFKNELNIGTPFTLGGANELLRLGILILAVPTGCAVAGSIAEGIIAGFLKVEKAAAMDVCFENGASIALGVMFIITSLLCRYGAELNEKVKNQ